MIENDLKKYKKPGLVKQITSASNQIIKDIKSLSLKKNRDKQGLFLAEGLKLVTDAVETGWQIDTLIYANKMADQPHLQTMAAKARTNGANILEVSDKILAAISKRDNPQMVIGVFRQSWNTIEQLASAANGAGDVLLALDRVRDPGNLGTIIRTCDAVGVKGVVLVGETTDPYSIEATRATMGSIFHMPLARLSQSDFLNWRRRFNGQVAGTHLEGAIDYRAVNWNEKPSLVIMGNEQQGLSKELAGSCDNLVIIPMAGQADSLNLAVATGIMLFEVRRDQLNV